MERSVRENITIRWFCGFSLTEETPDHTYFCKLRKRIGEERIENIFNNINATLKEKGLFGNVFTFIDASALISKTALWEERDKTIKDGAETLNNTNVSDYIILCFNLSLLGKTCFVSMLYQRDFNFGVSCLATGP